MRFARGLFRLWLVGAVLWAGVVIYDASTIETTELLQARGGEVAPWELNPPTRRQLVGRTAATILPPAFVLALGASLVWQSGVLDETRARRASHAYTNYLIEPVPSGPEGGELDYAASTDRCDQDSGDREQASILHDRRNGMFFG